MTALTSSVPWIGTFLAGVVVGYLIRDAWRVGHTGRSAIMDDTKHLGRAVRTGYRSATSSRRLGITLVTCALIANAVVGVLLLTSRASERELRDVVRCVTTYNEAAGKARDERDESARTATALEVTLWRSIEKALSTPSGGPEAVAALAAVRVALLEPTTATREAAALAISRYLTRVSSSPGAGAAAIDAIDTYLKAIEELRNTRAANPYPAPDVCETLGE